MQNDYIASDDANPNFVGQRDPDKSLSVRFFSVPMQDNFQSKEKGRPIFTDVDMVEILLPGDDKNIIKTFAREDHKERWPRQWAHYASKMEGDQRLIGKTPLSAWQRLTPAQSEELRAMKFFAVDDIANASDAALQRIGMVAGMSPHAFRDAAQRFLELAAGDAKESKIAEENAELHKQMAEMRSRLEHLAAAQSAAAAPAGLEQLAAANGAAQPQNVNPQVRTKKQEQ